jgi:hypothetical protein
MPDYKAIADRAVEIIGGADPAQYQTAFDVMADETIAITKDIDTADIKQYLILTDKWLGIKSSAEIAAQITMDALNVFDTFVLTDPVTGPMVDAKLGLMMDALIAASLIDATDKAVIMAMGIEDSPRFQSLTTKQVQNALDMRLGGEI